MKKLMIALAVAVSAVALNAATIDWSFSETAKFTSSPYSLNGYTAYLFTSAAWTQALEDGISADTFTAGKGSFVDSAALAETPVSTVGVKWATGNPEKWTDASAASGNYYIVLVDSGKTAYAASDSLAATAYDTKETHTKANWAITASDTPLKSSDFTSINVPEPTSGLLLLLGMAGLALRRKQK